MKSLKFSRCSSSGSPEGLAKSGTSRLCYRIQSSSVNSSWMARTLHPVEVLGLAAACEMLLNSAGIVPGQGRCPLQGIRQPPVFPLVSPRFSGRLSSSPPVPFQTCLCSVSHAMQRSIFHNRISQRADPRNFDDNFVSVFQREIVFRNDSRAGQKKCSIGEMVLAAQPFRQFR